MGESPHAQLRTRARFEPITHLLATFPDHYSMKLKRSKISASPEAAETAPVPSAGAGSPYGLVIKRTTRGASTLTVLFAVVGVVAAMAACWYAFSGFASAETSNLMIRGQILLAFGISFVGSVAVGRVLEARDTRQA